LCCAKDLPEVRFGRPCGTTPDAAPVGGGLAAEADRRRHRRGKTLLGRRYLQVYPILAGSQTRRGLANRLPDEPGPVGGPGWEWRRGQLEGSVATWDGGKPTAASAFARQKWIGGWTRMLVLAVREQGEP